MLAKKIPQSHSNPLIEDEIKSLKKELDIKYEKMNYRKEQIRKVNMEDFNEDLQLKQRQDANRIS